MTRLEELTLKEIDGELSKKETRELEELLRTEPEARAQHRQLLDLEVHLRNLDEGMDVSDAVMKSVLPSRKEAASWKPARSVLDSPFDRFFFRFVLPLGAAAVFLAAFLVLQSVPYDRAELSDIEGKLQIVRNGRMKLASRDIDLQPGDRIVALPGSGAELRYRDESVVKLSAGTQVVFEADIAFEEKPSKTIELLTGQIDANVSRQPEGEYFVVKTPHALAIVRGTRFTLSAGPQQTRLAVQHGRVDLLRAADGSSVSVKAGKVALAKPAPPSSRAREGLVAYYTFQQGKGNQVLDRSGYASPLHLKVNGAQPNSVSWMAHQGIRFPKEARLESKPASKIIAACQASQALTVEAWIQPAKTDQSGPARIVTLSEGSEATNFTLGQQGTHFVARTTTSRSRSELKASKFRIRTQLTHVVLTCAPNGRRILWINGKQMAQDKQKGDFSKWTPELHLALADDPKEGKRFWQGNFRLVAIYSRSLSQEEIQRHHRIGPTL